MRIGSVILVPASCWLQRTSSFLSVGSLGFELLCFSYLSSGWLPFYVVLHPIFFFHQIVINKDVLSFDQSLKQELYVDSMVKHVLQVEVFRVCLIHFIHKLMDVHLFIVSVSMLLLAFSLLPLV